MTDSGQAGDDVLRQKAVYRLKKKAAFRSHLTSYLLVNALLVGNPFRPV